jgi:hypothetical protein
LQIRKVSVADSEFGKRGRKMEEEMGGTEKRLRGQKAMQQQPSYPNWLWC